MNRHSGAADSQLRKNSTGGEPKPMDGLNYGNLVQTKAQQQAMNPDLAYIKRDSANDRIAKANAMKQRKQQSRNTAGAQGYTQPVVKSANTPGPAASATQTTP